MNDKLILRFIPMMILVLGFDQFSVAESSDEVPAHLKFVKEQPDKATIEKLGLPALEKAPQSLQKHRSFLLNGRVNINDPILGQGSDSAPLNPKSDQLDKHDAQADRVTKTTKPLVTSAKETKQLLSHSSKHNNDIDVLPVKNSNINSAVLNRQMMKAQWTEKNKKRVQSMTLNRARAENAPRPIVKGFTIQLYASVTDDALVNFLEAYPGLSGATWQDFYHYQGQVWHTVVYGRFHHENEAVEAMRQLPMYVKGLSPWVRELFQTDHFY